MERCANTEALNRYENEIVKQELRTESDIQCFRDSMDDAVSNLCNEFIRHSKLNNVNRKELRAILMDDIEEQLG